MAIVTILFAGAVKVDWSWSSWLSGSWNSWDGRLNVDWGNWSVWISWGWWLDVDWGWSGGGGSWLWFATFAQPFAVVADDVIAGAWRAGRFEGDSANTSVEDWTTDLAGVVAVLFAGAVKSWSGGGRWLNVNWSWSSGSLDLVWVDWGWRLDVYWGWGSGSLNLVWVNWGWWLNVNWSWSGSSLSIVWGLSDWDSWLYIHWSWWSSSLNLVWVNWGWRLNVDWGWWSGSLDGVWVDWSWWLNVDWGWSGSGGGVQAVRQVNASSVVEDQTGWAGLGVGEAIGAQQVAGLTGALWIVAIRFALAFSGLSGWWLNVDWSWSGSCGGGLWLSALAQPFTGMAYWVIAGTWRTGNLRGDSTVAVVEVWTANLL